MLKTDSPIFLQNMNMIARQLFLLFKKSKTFWDNPRKFIPVCTFCVKNHYIKHLCNIQRFLRLSNEILLYFSLFGVLSMHDMIHWICNVKAKNEFKLRLPSLGIQGLEVVLCTRRMRSFGHIEPSTGSIAEVCKLKMVHRRDRQTERPKKSWDDVLVYDRKKLGMDSANSQNCSEWRGRLQGRLVRQASSPSLVEEIIGFQMDMMMIMLKTNVH